MRWAIIILAIIAAALLVYAAYPAGAGGKYAGGDPDRAKWFKSLRTNPTAAAPQGASCCDVSDCYKTKARFVGATWWALLRTGREVMVPPDRVLNKPTKSIDGEAYLCASDGVTASDGRMQNYIPGYTPPKTPPIHRPPEAESIYCFIPPWSIF